MQEADEASLNLHCWCRCDFFPVCYWF